MSGITLKEVADTAIPTPSAGKATVFLDVADGEPKYKDDTGTVASLVGTPGAPGANGQGVPTGGSAGQVLTKQSGTDFDTDWEDPATASGDVVGPGSAVDDRIATFDGVTGKLIQDGGATVAQLDTRGKQAIFIHPNAMFIPAAGNVAARGQVASGSGMPDIVSVDFDPSTQENIQFNFVPPKKWNAGTITYVAHWSHGATTTNFGVAIGLQAACAGNDDVIGLSWGSSVVVTDTGGTTDDLYTTAESGALTIAGTPAKDDMVFFRCFRQVANGADTLAVDMRLMGITLFFTTDASTDA